MSDIPEWIEWTDDDGPNCPVGADVNGDIKLRDGEIILDVPLSEYHWEHGYDDPTAEIIAYRIRTS